VDIPPASTPEKAARRFHRVPLERTQQVKQSDLLMTGENRINSLMTHGDVAKFAQVSPGAVRAWADSGRLRFIRTAGGVRLFERSDVERFLEAWRPVTLGGLGSAR